MNWNGIELPNNPYYQDDAVYIIHADCRDILPLIPGKIIDLVITDPPWVNLTDGMNTENPIVLFAEMCLITLPILSERALIILGCDTDPRILSPINLKF